MLGLLQSLAPNSVVWSVLPVLVAVSTRTISFSDTETMSAVSGKI